MFNIEEELKKLPARPGVYIMHDADDTIIYVGKAISLKNRVRQYFQGSRNLGVRKEQMVEQIARFEYIVTDSELEALVLECNLIKEHTPKYNILLKDDKTYPFIKVTVGEDYPRIQIVRRVKKDKSRYYGPYSSAMAVKDVVELTTKLYRLRTCSRNLPRDIGKERPCLYHQIHQCDAPCQGYISKEDYKKKVDELLDFLNGNHKEILKELEEKMLAASQEMNFEDAAQYRDLIQSVKRIGERQKITDQHGEDKDVVAVAQDGEDAVAQVFFIRGGKLIGRDHFYLKVAKEDPRAQIVSSFLKQFYAGTPFIPKEIMIQEEIEDREVISQWLEKRKGRKVHIRIPKKGTKEKLVELAQRNAELVLNQDKERIKREEGRTIGAAKEIAGMMGLPQMERIEAYDISNISGFQSVGSMIVYEKGRPKRSDYRKFRIKSVQGPNDYASMEEVLTRRFVHGLDEQEARRKENLDEEFGSFTRFPDLIMMDGGRGQVNIALEVLGKLNLQIPVCGMVKDDKHRTRGLYYNNKEIPIDRNSEGFKLITRIQDEAHRFAIEFHRSLRSKGQVHSILDDIPGIGPARRKALMKQFPGPDKIKEASVEELKAVPSMNERAAEAVYGFFHKEQEKKE
ncbi:excinuclease ABC subunit UvrC [Blautia pseudococcoides]|uniref:UvrABC system protein C n=1 Tax=Blautia pseudococcoides TaxID=1796616 RepID=A0A1C7I448_9FIRM|nr:excinuclease ABC subunit UvrC [Blautia pseudococcoides]ANU74457.1 excinuclease ABC subunit C [Blautia pseudococcoides]ASU31447.1 excinuclease ABC subunit UvrC [Blautia pseudococcoides]QJU15493.1 excinuclease ABC subunit UvrC [Blautia pseudococcoides]QQQ91995.1 excinuclease ABC subunit UvrC [Blautia pseudococcoides]